MSTLRDTERAALPLPRPRSFARTVLRRLGDLGCVALAGGSLLVWSARWFWLGEVATSFTWYLGWAGLLGALALALVRRPRLACAAALLAAVHLWPELSLWLPDERSGAADGAGQELTIATCNLLWGNHEAARIGEWLEQHDPDLVAFQEVSVESRAALEGLSKSYPFLVVSPDREWHERTWGTAILSRVPLVSTRRLPPPPGNTHWPLEVVVKLGGEQLVVRNVHPTRPGRAIRNAKRNAMLGSIAAEDWSGRCLLLGDLNVTSTSPAFSELLETSGLRDSRSGFGRQPTYTPTELGGVFSVAIDHILVSDSLRMIDRRIVAIPGSDHRGVVARIGGLAASRTAAATAD